MNLLFKLIRYDLRIGIKDRILSILLPVSIFFVCSILSKGLNLGERLAIIFSGGTPEIEDDTGVGSMPVYWIMVNTGNLLFSLEYPLRDLSLHGRQILIRSRSKKEWWFSKCIWCMVNTFIYYIVGILTEISVCMFFGDKLTFALRMVVLSPILEVNIPNISDTISMSSGVFLLCVIPLLSMIASNLLQMIMGVATNHIIAFLFGVTMLTMAIYIQSPLIIGNYSMLSRFSTFNQHGLNTDVGLIIISIELAIAFFVGMEIFNRLDILEPKKNGE